MYRLINAVLFSLVMLCSYASAGLDSKPQSLDIYAPIAAMDQIAGTTMADGRLILFVIEWDREVAYRIEKAPGSRTWSKKKGLDIYANQIAVGKHADGRITLFNIGTLGNVLYSTTQTAPNSEKWSKEVEIEGSYATQIEPVVYPDGRLALFFLDMGREIGVIEETAVGSGKWGKHKMLDLNGNRFAVGYHPDGSLDIAIIGTMANVLSHATLAANGEWEETDIDDTYAMDLSFINSVDGTLHLFFIDMQREVVRVDMSQKKLRAKEMDLYANDIETVRGADGAIEIIMVGTVGNVLGHSRQVSAEKLEWGKEKEMEGYAKQLNAVELEGEPALFVVAPLASEVYVY